MELEKEHTYKIIYVDTEATPDIIKAYGEPQQQGETVTLTVGHSHGYPNYLRLFGVDRIEVVK